MSNSTKMSHPLALERRLHYYKQLQRQIDAHTTKAHSIALRKRWLERQRVANYQNEHDRLLNLMSTSNLGATTKESMAQRIKKLEELGAEAVNGIK